MLTCKHCGKECKNENSLRNHERLCKENPNGQESSLLKYHQSGASLGKTPWNRGLPAWNRGLPGTFTGKTHSDETKQKMSESKNELYASGWECKAGRCPKYDYSSPIAGEIKVDGSWELIFCKYADAAGLTWRRNKTRFTYIKPDGKSSTYQPDFYVDDWKSYVEVKGYETELDKAKWSQFVEQLRILRKKEISELDEWLKSAPC